MPPNLSDDDLDALAERLTDPVADNVAASLDPGWYDDQLVLSRRQVIALGGLGLSATGLMALGVDEATAQSAAGQVGDSSNPLDVFGYDLHVANALQTNLDVGGNTLTNIGAIDSPVDFSGQNLTNIGTATADSVEADDTNTKRIGSGEYHYAGGYDGGTPDERLDNTLANASDGDTIYLENSTYSDTRTISDRIDLTGTNARGGTEIDATWTLSEAIALDSVRLSSGSVIEVTGDSANLSRLNGFTDINISASNVLVINSVWAGNVTLESGSSDCVIDSLSGGASITDNGSGNVVGDLS